MAVIDAGGITPTDLSGYLERMETVLRDALGQDLDLAAETPQGQLAGLLALAFAETDELAVHVAAGLNLEEASGRQLDSYGHLLGVYRRIGSSSLVTASLRGRSGTAVPAGNRARTEAGDVFRLLADATIGAAGSVDAEMESVELGPVPAAPGALSIVATPTPGWLGVTNATAATLGRLAETDAELRERYRTAVSIRSSGTVASMRARLLEEPAILDAEVAENATDAPLDIRGVRLPAHSVLAIVRGGPDAAVWAAIRSAKPLGIPTAAPTGARVDADGIAFLPVDEHPTIVRVETLAGFGFPADGLQQIASRLVGWFAGSWSSGAGDFETGGLAIGESVDVTRLYSPINSVRGHTVQSLAILSRSGLTLLPDDTPPHRLYTLDAADVSVSLV